MKVVGQISRIRTLLFLLVFAFLAAGQVNAQDGGDDKGPKPEASAATEPVGPLPIGQVDNADILERADRLVEQSVVQSELPADQVRPDAPDWNLGWLVPVFRFIGWLVVAAFAIGCAVLIYLMFSNASFNARIMGRKRGGAGDADQEPIDEAPLWSRDALEEADTLASKGKFSEAVHILLLGSLGELKTKFLANLPSSLTSREIAAKIPMPEAAKSALSVLILSVEISLFGDQGLAQNDYDHCRHAYLRFAEPGAQGAAGAAGE